MRQQLTFVLTTSPSPVCPSTELVDLVLASLLEHAPACQSCHLVIVCDSAKLGTKLVFRSGRVDEAAWTAYVEYKQRLQSRASADSFGFGSAEVVELAEHHGFGFAVHAALQHVRTRLVCVVQHDRALLRPVDLPEICDAMLSPTSRAAYVLLPTRATADYPHKMRVRLGERGLRPPASSIEPHALALPTAGRRLLPCLTYYDSTHVATTAFYLDFVFCRGAVVWGGVEKAAAYLQALPPEAQEKARVFAAPDRLVTKGAFLENELAPQQLDDVETMGVAGCVERWRTYLYDDGVALPTVGHLNGAQTMAWERVSEIHGKHRQGAGQRWQRVGIATAGPDPGDGSVASGR